MFQICIHRELRMFGIPMDITLLVENFVPFDSYMLYMSLHTEKTNLTYN